LPHTDIIDFEIGVTDAAEQERAFQKLSEGGGVLMPLESFREHQL
jgi:hypothetical protein